MRLTHSICLFFWLQACNLANTDQVKSTKPVNQVQLTKKEQQTDKIPKNSQLQFRKAILAKKKESGGWSMRKNEVPTFVAGEKIGLILFDVTGFLKGTHGKHHMDVDLVVVSPSSKIIVDQKNTMGAQGKRILKGGVAKSSVGLFHSSPEMESGTYKIQVTVHDKIGGGQVKQVMYFDLEKSTKP